MLKHPPALNNREPLASPVGFGWRVIFLVNVPLGVLNLGWRAATCPSIFEKRRLLSLDSIIWARS